MVMRHGCTRETVEKLIKFLAAQTHGEPLQSGHTTLMHGREETIGLYAWKSTVNLRQVGPECWTLM